MTTIDAGIKGPPRICGEALAREGASHADRAAHSLAAAAWAVADHVLALLVCTVLVMSARVFIAAASTDATMRMAHTLRAVRELEKAVTALTEFVDARLDAGAFRNVSAVAEADVEHAVWLLGLATTDLALCCSGGSRPAGMPLEGSPLAKGGAR